MLGRHLLETKFDVVTNHFIPFPMLKADIAWQYYENVLSQSTRVVPVHKVCSPRAERVDENHKLLFYYLFSSFNSTCGSHAKSPFLLDCALPRKLHWLIHSFKCYVNHVSHTSSATGNSDV
jgi:hypothetical protein